MFLKHSECNPKLKKLYENLCDYLLIIMVPYTSTHHYSLPTPSAQRVLCNMLGEQLKKYSVALALRN